jgi:dipeptidyl aminopeptidase/acylaminoacyl peptidase
VQLKTEHMQGRDKGTMIVHSNYRMPQMLKVLCAIGLLALIFLSFGYKNKASDRPLSLGYFKDISDISLSPDGNQLLFTASGHKDYRETTVYRFDMKSGKLYRYLPPGKSEILNCGRYSPGSSRFVFEIIPHDSKDRNLYDDMQIAIANQDGSGLRVLTQGEGVKHRPAISFNEKTLVFFKGRISDSGSPLRKQRSKAIGFDLFKVDLQSGEETQLTRLEFYEVSAPYFDPDGKGIVFGGLAPLRLPNTVNWRIVNKFRDTYKQKYKENIILWYPLDGSAVNQEPAPLFTFDAGAEKPIVTNDGSIWFEGRVGLQGWIYYYRRFPNGKLIKISPEDYGLGLKGGHLFVLYEMSATPDGSRLEIMSVNQDTDERFIRIIYTKTREQFEVTVPAVVENIHLK